jgi:transposase
VAPPAAAAGISAVADSLWQFSNFPECRGVGVHPPLPGHNAARDWRSRGQPDSRHHRHPKRQDHRKRGPRGYDAAKKVKGRKRHIGVDTSGFLLGVLVHAAGPSGNAKRYIQDADSAWDLLKKIKHLYCWLQVVFADSIYNRLPVLLACFLLGLTLIIVRRIAGTTGFVVIPRRWIVERTLGWFGRWRRLSKDYEELPEVSEAMVTLAAIRMMLQRLAHPNRKRLPPPWLSKRAVRGHPIEYSEHYMRFVFV